MKTIEIKTQAEFDALKDDFKVYTEIRIIGSLDRINKSFKNSFIYVSDSATIESVSGSATIESVSGSATIEYVYGSATIKYVYDSATIESVSGSATIEYVSGSATIKYVSRNSILRIIGNNVEILEARQQVVIVYQNCKGSPKKKDKTVIINRTKTTEFDLKNFIAIYNVEKKRNKIILYKFVQSDFTDFYTSKIKYEVGTIVKCPDWDSNNGNECGGGLHVSPTIDFCKQFNSSRDGHALKVEVAIKDIVVHPNPQYPYKVRCKQLKVLEEIKE